MSRPERGSKWANIAFRLVVSISVWITVSAISINTAWKSGRKAPAGRLDQWRTQMTLGEINRALVLYEAEFHGPPASLDQLGKLENFNLSFENDGSLKDGWGRPFRYRVDGTNCLITSYGRDGKPGGEGLDCDLNNKNLKSEESLPTFHQFIHDMPTGGMIQSCVICGGLAFLLSFFMIKLPKPEVLSYLETVLTLGVTLVGAIIVATIIAALHVPSGH